MKLRLHRFVSSVELWKCRFSMKIEVISKVCFQGKLRFISTTTVNYTNECLEPGVIICILRFKKFGKFFEHSKEHFRV